MTRPDPADLLAIARSTLLAEVAPGLSGAARFKLLMAANAMAIAERALRAGPAAENPALADPALCAAIRGGAHDDDAALGAALLEAAAAACRISAPRALESGAISRTDRAECAATVAPCGQGRRADP